MVHEIQHGCLESKILHSWGDSISFTKNTNNATIEIVGKINFVNEEA